MNNAPHLCGMDVAPMETIEQLAIRAIADELGQEATAATKLSDLKCDSLEFLELMLALENKFGRKIPEEAIARFQTVADIVAFFA